MRLVTFRNFALLAITAIFVVRSAPLLGSTTRKAAASPELFDGRLFVSTNTEAPLTSPPEALEEEPPDGNDPPTFNLTIVVVSIPDTATKSFNLSDWHDFSSKSLSNKRKYCDHRPEVKCKIVTEVLDKGRDNKWTKVRALVGEMERKLRTGRRSGEWLWQLDLDSLITNHSLSASDIFSEHGIDPITGLIRGRPELGQTGLIATNDCNGLNSGSLFWRVSFANLLALHTWYQTYYKEVPGLVMANTTEKSDGRAIPKGQYSALQSQLHLLPARTEMPKGGEIQSDGGCGAVKRGKSNAVCDVDLMLSYMADEEVAAWYRAIAAEEVSEAIAYMNNVDPSFLDKGQILTKDQKPDPVGGALDPAKKLAVERARLRSPAAGQPMQSGFLKYQGRRIPKIGRKFKKPSLHDQASLLHLLDQVLPQLGINHTVFLPQHKINAYPHSLFRRCKSSVHSDLAPDWQRTRDWQRGDLVAHLPSCRGLKLGRDGFYNRTQFSQAEENRILRGVKTGNVCLEWLTKWGEWFGNDGLESTV